MTKLAPTAADIEAIAEATLRTVPEAFRAEALTVGLIVDEIASDDLMHELEIENPFELTGMYEGIPLIERSVMDQPVKPSAIWLFRRAILDEWVERGDVSLEDLVSHIVVHELAHHFGWSDDDIATIDRWWE